MNNDLLRKEIRVKPYIVHRKRLHYDRDLLWKFLTEQEVSIMEFYAYIKLRYKGIHSVIRWQNEKMIVESMFTRRHFQTIPYMWYLSDHLQKRNHRRIYGLLPDQRTKNERMVYE